MITANLSRREQIVELQHCVSYLRRKFCDHDEDPPILVAAESELAELIRAERATKNFNQLFKIKRGYQHY